MIEEQSALWAAGGETSCDGAKTLCGALWAAVGKTNFDTARALCGLCEMLVDSEMSFFGCIAGAFAKFTCFENRIFENETQPSEMLFNRFRFFTVLIYTIE